MTHDFARLRAMPGLRHGRGASAKQVLRFETESEVVLPESFRAFLTQLGWAAAGANSIYGLGDDVPEELDLDRNLVLERVDTEPMLAPHLVPIMNDGAGNHYCLNTKHMKGSECPVVFWDHEHPRGSSQTPKKSASSFPEWLDLLVTKKL